MKSALLLHRKRVTGKLLKELKRKLQYDRVYLLKPGEKDETTPDDDASRIFRIIPYTNRSDITRRLDAIIEESEKNTMLIPFFRGDANAKYNVYCSNKMFGTNLNPRIFKQKDAMSRFLGEEVIRKKNLRLSYDDVNLLTYRKAANALGKSFILKPQSASSSMLNFKISTSAEFEKAKSRLKKRMEYVLEEYLMGNLYSIDLYCDGEHIFLLCFAREVSFVELLDQLSGKYIEKYQGNLTEDFLHFLPLRYTLPLERIRNFELDFIRMVTEKLVNEKYCGFIHLEFKSRREQKEAGFIEWGARLGGYRGFFIEEMHQLTIENLPLEILVKKDFSRFRFHKGMYFLKNRHPDRNFVGIKTNVLQKTHILKILKKIPNYLETPFGDFLKTFLWDNWRIAVKNLTFHVSTSKDHYIYPFYERNDTRFDYILELDEESFQRFLKKKHRILERLVFHDYK